MLTLISCDANAITWPKSHVTPHFRYLYLRNIIILLMFHCFDLRNAVVSFTMPLALYDAIGTGVSIKMSCCTSFQLYCHYMMPISASLDASANGFTWPKRSCCMSLWSSLPMGCNGIIGSISHWCWQQRHHMTSKVMLHFILIIWT